ncbi:MAG TPA: alpha/beta hydrolase [Woeseiaceae bacterium]|nr:alpha/beta hydrolase [Woeseiaceae bacterium]
MFGLGWLAGCSPPAEGVAKVSATPAQDAEVSFVSEGNTVTGTLHFAEGAGPHPTVLFLSGFPGWPESPDFLEPVRDAGYNVLFFPYRGTWGSDGLFSAENALADAEAALAFLRSPEAESEYHVDAEAIVPYGTSFGGWVALNLAAEKPRIDCVAAHVVANIGRMARQWQADDAYRDAWRQNFEQMSAELPIRLEGGAGAFMATLMERADEYDVVSALPALRGRTVILFGAEQDEVAPMDAHYLPIADGLAGGNTGDVTLMTAPGGHQDVQPSWDAELLSWLREDCIGGR